MLLQYYTMVVLIATKTTISGFTLEDIPTLMESLTIINGITAKATVMKIAEVTLVSGEWR